MANYRNENAKPNLWLDEPQASPNMGDYSLRIARTFVNPAKHCKHAPGSTLNQVLILRGGKMRFKFTLLCTPTCQ